MRTVTTLTTNQLATGIVRNIEGTNPNLAPSDDAVALVTERLNILVGKFHDNLVGGQAWDKSALSSHQAGIVQESYLKAVEAGAYDFEPQPVAL